MFFRCDLIANNPENILNVWDDRCLTATWTRIRSPSPGSHLTPCPGIHHLSVSWPTPPLSSWRLLLTSGCHSEHSTQIKQGKHNLCKVTQRSYRQHQEKLKCKRQTLGDHRSLCIKQKSGSMWKSGERQPIFKRKSKQHNQIRRWTRENKYNGCVHSTFVHFIACNFYRKSIMMYWALAKTTHANIFKKHLLMLDVSNIL